MLYTEIQISASGGPIGRRWLLGPRSIRLQLAMRCIPVHPAEIGQEWNVQPTGSPVIPRLARERLVGD